MAFESLSTSTPMVSSGGMPNYGWGNGTGAGGAALAAGAGALIGGLLFGNGGLGGGVAKDTTVELAAGAAETSALQSSLFAGQLAAADRGYQQTIAFNSSMNSVDRDVLQGTYGTSRQMCDGFNESNVIALQNKYDSALQLANLEHHQDECCCKTNEAIMCMGYNTQIRDMQNTAALSAQIQALACEVKDVEMRGQLREQERIIAAFRERETRETIRDCIKDTFCKTSSALNQIGLNEQIINPDCKWPPFIPSACC